MKTPEEIADEVTGKKYIGTWGGLTANSRKIARDAAIIAIEADRAQRTDAIAEQNGKRAARLYAHWYIGDSIWADEILYAYNNPDEVIAQIEEQRK